MKPFQALKKTIDSVRNDLKHVRVPVIIFASSEDELIPHAYQQWLFDRLRATKFFITLPQEGHSPSPEAAEVIIKTFLVLVDTFCNHFISWLKGKLITPCSWYPRASMKGFLL